MQLTALTKESPVSLTFTPTIPKWIANNYHLTISFETVNLICGGSRLMF